MIFNSKYSISGLKSKYFLYETNSEHGNETPQSKPLHPFPRSISILPVALEILEKAVHHNLMTFLENKNLLTDCTRVL